MTDYSQFEFIKVDKPAEWVLHIQFNRPKVHNALHQAAYEQYRSVLRLAQNDGDVRAIVLSGVGQSFCSGVDLFGLASMHTDEIEDVSRRGIRTTQAIDNFQDCIHQAHLITKPVIAVAHGYAYGLAVDILTAVDIRIASRDAKMSVKEVDIGMAADIGTLQRFPKIVGNLGWIKEISYTSRVFEGDEALQQGFVQSVFDTKEQAIEGALKLASLIATKSPVAVHGTKRSLNFAIEHTIADGLQQIATFNGHGLGVDLMEGVMAFQSKSKPKFEKL